MNDDEMNEQELLDAGYLKRDKVEEVLKEAESMSRLANEVILSSKDKPKLERKDITNVTSLTRRLRELFDTELPEDEYFNEGPKKDQRKSTQRLDYVNPEKREASQKTMDIKDLRERLNNRLSGKDTDNE